MAEEKLGPRAPLYLQLREVIRGKIESGEYPPGTCIPSEHALSEAYGLHRLSVRSAVSALIYEGLLKSVQGKGVFVVGERRERDLETVGGFRQTMEDLGRAPSTKVIVKAVRPAGALYAKRLRISPREDVYYVKRVCRADGEPYALEEIYIPKKVLPGLPEIDLELFSIYDLYASYGFPVVRARQSLELARLEPMEAKLLGIGADQAVLKFQCVSCDRSGRPLEYARTYTRADQCTFRVHYQNREESAAP